MNDIFGKQKKGPDELVCQKSYANERDREKERDENRIRTKKKIFTYMLVLWKNGFS